MNGGRLNGSEALSRNEYEEVYEEGRLADYQLMDPQPLLST